MPHPGTGHRRHPLPGLRRHEVFPLSCGHRFCPQCQHEAGETWLERQRAKLLPVDYYLITFTLPATLRALVYDHQREAYDLLIRLAWQTLAAFGLRDKALHGDLGATVVLHTHSRALDFHPHVHVVLPAGAIDPATRHWTRKTGKFLFPHKALAKVFRAKWFAAMKELGWAVQADLPAQWVVDCKPVGNGDKALTYLGRYLYRGVLPEKNILRHADGQVTFRYTDNTGTHKTRTLAGADFLWLLLRTSCPRASGAVATTAFSMPTASGSSGCCTWCCASSRPSPSNDRRGAANTAAER